MTEAERLAWLTLSMTPKMTPLLVHQRLAQGDCGVVDLLARDAWPDGVLAAETVEFLQQPSQIRIDEALNWAVNGKQLLAYGDANYPEQLLDLADAPLVLYAIGDVAILNQAQIAIVGSRSPSSGGKDNATAFASELAQAGFIITSGLALGVDTCAHQGALQATGKTIAVIGTGADRVYPAQNQALARQIAANGCIISEFWLGEKPLNWHFPRRNRIIAALSQATLVVEAALSSGSLITAKQALELGREVMAIPGSIHNPLTRGPHQLIRQGAKLVETVADIIEELGGTVARSFGVANEAVDPEHETLLNAMGFDPVTPDLLVDRTGFKPEAVASMLLLLELRGQIDSQFGQYQRRR